MGEALRIAIESLDSFTAKGFYNDKLKSEGGLIPALKDRMDHAKNLTESIKELE